MNKPWETAHIIPNSAFERVRELDRANNTNYITKGGMVRKLGDLEVGHLENIKKLLEARDEKITAHLVQMVISAKESK